MVRTFKEQDGVSIQFGTHTLTSSKVVLGPLLGLFSYRLPKDKSERLTSERNYH